MKRIKESFGKYPIIPLMIADSEGKTLKIFGFERII